MAKAGHQGRATKNVSRETAAAQANAVCLLPSLPRPGWMKLGRCYLWFNHRGRVRLHGKVWLVICTTPGYVQGGEGPLRACQADGAILGPGAHQRP
eukprot:5974749-Alexandrium_andersonii.AAC.1